METVLPLLNKSHFSATHKETHPMPTPLPHSLLFCWDVIHIHAGMGHSVMVPGPLIGGKGGVDSEMLHVGFQDRDDVGLAREFH